MLFQSVGPIFEPIFGPASLNKALDMDRCDIQVALFFQIQQKKSDSLTFELQDQKRIWR
jgi:hypothetical protein